MIYTAKLGGKLVLGKVGEHRAVTILFQVQTIIEEFGKHGQFELLNRRPTESIPYPCYVAYKDGIVSWTINNSDVAFDGYGQCELQYIKNDTVVKSVSWDTRIFPALADLKTEFPDEYQSWVDSVLKAGAEAKAAKEAIEAFDVSARTLDVKYDATIEKVIDEAGAVTLNFGIPRGATGNSGVYIGEYEPTDEDINVWIDTEEIDPDYIDITTGQIKKGSVTEEKLSNGAVTLTKLSQEVINYIKSIVEETAESVEIPSGGVSTDSIANSAVTSEKITNNAVTTEKINDGAVTTSKIASTSITVEKLAAEVLNYFRKKDDSIPFTDITGDIPSNRVLTVDGNLNPLVLRYGMHFFNSIEEYNASGYASTNAICFVKKTGA